ncbi:MAG: M28 family peptidase [Bacteroidales bacterium]|jgi:hypothetical protein|nr:M28 family peptidase [Bacteroidales bacterium]
MKIKFLLLIFFLFPIFIFSQNIEKTKERIAVLTSENFYGRGYLNNGMGKAAKFIAGEFSKNNINKFGNSYFQNYNYPINTFPKKFEIKLDNQLLKPGIDYILGGFTPTCKGNFEIFYPDSVLINNYDAFVDKILQSKVFDKFLVINYSLIADKDLKNKYISIAYNNQFKFAGIIELVDNEFLISLSQKQKSFPQIKINNNIINNNCKNISIDIKAELNNNFKTKNIIGYIEGEIKDTFFVFSAHYDHVGGQGKYFFAPGAHDNASGTAFVLDLADYYSKNKPKYSIAFMLFSGEEAGLLGSSFYATNPLFDLKKIKCLINLDMVGTGDNGFTIVNGELPEYQDVKDLIFEINSENNYFEEGKIKLRGESCNSDHCPFYNKGVKAFFIYTMGNEKTYYHNPEDKLKTLNFAGYNQLFNILKKFVNVY